MKQRYYFEADKHQWEKPTERKYVFCTTAKTIVYAEDLEEAKVLAAKQLHDDFAGSGILLGEPRLIDVNDLPANWCYGYGDEQCHGTSEEVPMARIVSEYTYR